jgi:hypothetical protein
MIELTVKKIITTLIILLLVNIAFFPIASASTASSTNSVGAAPLLAPVVLGIFGIEIGADLAALLGLASAGGIMVVRYNDGSLAIVNTFGDYVKITNAVAHAAINGILDSLGLRSSANSYKHAYSRPEGGLQWNPQYAVTSAPDPCGRGSPESSLDYMAPDGKLLTRYYYDARGILEITWEYTKEHRGRLPHAHRWFLQFNEKGECIKQTIKDRRPGVIFDKEGNEILDYIPK